MSEVSRADVAAGIRKWFDDKHAEIIKHPIMYRTKAQVDLINDMRAEILDCYAQGHFPWEINKEPIEKPDLPLEQHQSNALKKLYSPQNEISDRFYPR